MGGNFLGATCKTTWRMPSETVSWLGSTRFEKSLSVGSRSSSDIRKSSRESHTQYSTTKNQNATMTCTCYVFLPMSSANNQSSMIFQQESYPLGSRQEQIMMEELSDPIRLYWSAACNSRVATDRFWFLMHQLLLRWYTFDLLRSRYYQG
jgi:hypothetical protein